jgi:hypothetical protein
MIGEPSGFTGHIANGCGWARTRSRGAGLGARHVFSTALSIRVAAIVVAGMTCEVPHGGGENREAGVSPARARRGNRGASIHARRRSH